MQQVPLETAITLPYDAVRLLHMFTREYTHMHQPGHDAPITAALDLVAEELAQVAEMASPSA